MTLLFYVNNQNLSLSPAQENIKVVADSKNYLKAKFIFQTKDWSSMWPVYVLFTYNDKTYKKYLGIEEGLDVNECFVANEVIKPGTFTVSIFGGDLITTNEISIEVSKSGYKENIVNQETTPGALEQMDTLLYKYANLCNEIYKECSRIQQELQGGNE